MNGLLDNAPSWFKSAMLEIGTRELPENRGPSVQRYIDLAHCGQQGDPWCAIFANAMLELNEIQGTRSASSQSFAHSDLFGDLLGAPCLGCIVVFWRMRPNAGVGHVGFYRGEMPGYIYTLGGNESDMVEIEMLPRNSHAFGLVGFYWPKGVPLPDERGPVLMPTGTPVHQTSVI